MFVLACLLACFLLASVEVRNVPDPAGDPYPLVVARPLGGQAHLRAGPNLRAVVCSRRQPVVGVIES